MTELIGEIFSKIFGNNSGLATFFVSMIPIMELKGGIPFGMSEAFWGNNALSQWQAFWLAYLGCSVVVVTLYFLFKPILKFLKKTKVFKGLANYIDNRVKKQTSKLEDRAEKSIEGQEGKTNPEQESVNIVKGINHRKSLLLKMLGVFALVAIPLPLTGVWIGTCVAVMVNLNFWQTMLAVQLGNLCAGLIISTICVIFPEFTHILIYIFLILVLIVLTYEIVKHFIERKKKANKK